MPAPTLTRIAGLVGIGLAGAIVLAWRRSTAAQSALDERTRRRLRLLADGAAAVEVA